MAENQSERVGKIRLPKGDEISSFYEPHCTGIAGLLPDSCCPFGFVYLMKQPIIRESRSDSSLAIKRA